jgi:glycosyltransferase involved in cell wall biosynthesis
MKRFILNFICKNESHVVLRMLESARSITDAIVAVDTGSEDNTIALIKGFGKQYNIPTFVHERLFDNFCNSRNYALEKAKEAALQLNYDLTSTWGFWFDCDEIMQISSQFKRDSIQQDLYYVKTRENEHLFSKQLFFRLSRNFYWIGPIHEYITETPHTYQSDYVEDITILYERVGASWNGNLEKKFLVYVEKLKEFVAIGNRTFRWVLYIGDSYTAAASYCRNEDRKRHLLVSARRYYEEAIELTENKKDQKYRSHERLAQNKIVLQEPWTEIKEDYLKAYSGDARHAETLCGIIEYYLMEGVFQIAKIYSSFAYKKYHGNVPKGKDITDVKEKVYTWKLLFYHYCTLLNTGETTAARNLYKQLKEIVSRNPENFTEQEQLSIHLNSPLVYLWRNRITTFKNSANGLYRSRNSHSKLVQ